MSPHRIGPSTSNAPADGSGGSPVGIYGSDDGGGIGYGAVVGTYVSMVGSVSAVPGDDVVASAGS